MKTQVLVIGAGPTGLALGAILARMGVQARIIDKGAARSDKSKALGVQAGTLESVSQVLGDEIAQKMVSAGRPTQSAMLYIDQGAPVTVDLSTIEGRFNFILILEQSETERILEETLESLGLRVERRRELVSIQETADGVICEIQNDQGEHERIHTDYVVGCDGAHSTVRHQLDFQFSGAAYDGTFILGDVKIDWPWEYGSVRTFASGKGALACFPMRGERRYRLIMIPKFVPRSSSSEISLEEFQSILSSLRPEPIRVSDPVWLTRFSVHHRMVDRFRKGRVFLAGDAAHIHSPAGGQGMNTGIQDAFNLGFKLAQVLHGNADSSLLDQYEKERKPVARNVLRGTDLVFKLALIPENFLIRIARNWLFRWIVGSKWIQRRVVAAISQVAIARREIAARSNLSDLGDTQAFLHEIFNQLSKLKIDVSQYPLDHLCYRTATLEEYAEMKKHLGRVGKFIHEAQIGGRPISTFKLYQPVKYSDREISVIELPAPKPGKPKRRGLEHVEFVIPMSLEEFIKKHPGVTFDTAGMSKPHTSEIEIKAGDYAIKFHCRSLEDAIAQEAGIRV